MPKREKSGPIQSLGTNFNRLVISKSNPLYSLWRSNLTLSEFKILDIYLSRINPHDPDHREVVFGKGELERCLGVQRIKPDELNRRLVHLMGNVVRLDDASEHQGFRLVTLFEEAVAEQDQNEQWTVRLECTGKAMKYFFNIEKLGYLQYKLRNVIGLKSRYAYILFLYVEKNAFRGTWEVEIDTLKQILGCDTEATYNEYKYFNKKVLKTAQREIIEKTERAFEFQPLRKQGRSFTHLRFHTFKNDADNEETAFAESIQSETHANDLWKEPLETFRFSKEQQDELFSILVTIDASKLPQLPFDESILRYHYMDQKAKEIKRRDKEKPIRNKFRYLLAMLKQDALADAESLE